MNRIISTVALALMFVATVQAAGSQSSAVIPIKRDDTMVRRHEQYVEIARKGSYDLLFLGDEYTEAWLSMGQAAWNKDLDPLKAVAFGLPGDGTPHLLWRLRNGELSTIKPKVVVLLIGSNNLINNTDDETVKGIKAVIHEIRTRVPSSKILLLGIFPIGESAKAPLRTRIKHINSSLATLDDGGKTIKYLDVGAKFLTADGTLPPAIMSDGLRLTVKGYEIWDEAMLPTLKQLIK